jgi:hypothetical protein
LTRRLAAAASPAARLIGPAARLIVPAARLIVPAPRPIVPAARLIVPAARLIVPAARLILLAATFALAAATPAPADSWGAPQRLAGPLSLDLAPARIAFSPGGAAAVGFGAQDEDHPAEARALVVSRSAHGLLASARRVPGAREILDLSFDGRALELLAGSAPAGLACCSSAGLELAGGRGQTIIRTLAGATVGRLLVLPRHVTMAVLGTARGVWVWQSSGGGARRLSPAAAAPQTLAAEVLPGGRPAVAWSTAGARTLSLWSMGAPRAAITLPRGHAIDELGLAGGTLAWVESWLDAAGSYHSVVAVADLARPAHPRAFPVAGLAAGLWLAANARGDELLAWKTCDAAGACTVRAVSRPARRRFGAVQTLAPIDASQAPAAAVGPHGAGLVGWIQAGHVYAAAQPRAGGSFADPRQVSATQYAADLALGSAPNGAALATWTQGTLATSVMAAIHH